jgi:hypothetical protein
MPVCSSAVRRRSMPLRAVPLREHYERDSHGTSSTYQSSAFQPMPSVLGSIPWRGYSALTRPSGRTGRRKAHLRR